MHIWRNSGILAITVGFLAVVAVPSANAQAADPDFQFPTPQICHSSDGQATHQIDGFTLSNQRSETTKTLPNGDTVTNSHGELIIRFVNHDTGRSLTEDVSGPEQTTVHPDGTIDQTAQGRNWWALGPRGQANTGRPGLEITTGPVALHVTPPVVVTFTQTGGTVIDLCKALGAA